MKADGHAIYGELGQDFAELVTLQYIHSVRTYKFRNQAPNEGARGVNVEIQAEVDHKEEAVQESVDELEVRVTCVNEIICGADTPEK